MRKLLLLLSLLVVTACGTNVTMLDINKTITIIENELQNMEIVSETTLSEVYDLDLSLMDEYVIKENTAGDWYAIIKTVDKNVVKNDMKDYLDKIKEFNQNYSPDRLQILENRLEKEIGDYLIYIVAENAEDIYSEIVDSL